MPEEKRKERRRVEVRKEEKTREANLEGRLGAPRQRKDFWGSEQGTRKKKYE